ncbi:hypothetical protein QAD02_008326 [Eretmocerus hayati]|uniref:Uncharacterized protein n=1 Tax=Eretmocerus hayati TaxID=131215 RepID=A0ACC2N8I7_9HYME|nr:hypothetical protein QAD02_008326 [Eretmocerus hayati]
MAFPRGVEWIQIAQDFQDSYGYPSCLKALDGRRFENKRPPNSGAKYYNRKQFRSIVLLAVCDAHHRFLYALVGSPGPSHDSGIFARSTLGRALVNNVIDFPAPEQWPNSDIVATYAFIADEGFGFGERVMAPYRKSANKTIEEMIFDIRLTEPRETVERAFGSLCSGFQVCGEKLGFDVTTSKNIIFCCMSMHNHPITVRMEKNLDTHDDGESEDSEPETDDDSDDCHENSENSRNLGDYHLDNSLHSHDFFPGPLHGRGIKEDLDSSSQLSSESDEISDQELDGFDGQRIREVLTTYFVTDGDCEWQWKKLQ